MVQAISVSISSQTLLTHLPDQNVLAEYVVSAIRVGGSIPKAVQTALSNNFDADLDAYYDHGAAVSVIGTPISFNFSASDELEDSKKSTIRQQIATDDSKTVNQIIIRDVEIQFVNPTKVFLGIVQSDLSWDNIANGWYEDDGFYPVDKAYWTGTTNNLGNFFDLEYGWASGGGVPDSIYKSVSTTYKSPNTVFYHVIYRYSTDATPVKRYWNYENNSLTGGNYDDLNLDASIVIGGQFFPVIPIRFNKLWMEDWTYYANNIGDLDIGLSYLGLSYENLKESIAEVDTADLENIDDVAVMLVLDLYSTNESSLAYLFEAFKRFHYNLDGSDQSNWWDWFNETGVWTGSDHDTNHRPRNLLEVRASVINMKIEYQYSTVEIVTGNINNALSAPWTENSKTHRPSGIENLDPPIVGEVVRKYVIGTELETSNSGIYRTDVLAYRMPLATDPTTKYVEVRLYGPRAIYNVKREGWGTDGEYHRSLDDWDTDAGMLVPISQDIAKLFQSQEESDIYKQAVRLYVTAYEIYDLGFFASNFFSFLIFIVQVVVTIATLGSGSPILEAAKKGVVELVKVLAINIAVGFAVTYALVQVVNILGIDAGIIIAAMAVAGALYVGGTGKNLLFNATDFLLIGSSAVQATNIVIADEFLNLQEEIKEWNEYVRDKQEEIDAFAASLDIGRVNYNLYDLITRPAEFFVHEDPTEFYNRTIHTGNPGVLSLETVSLYATEQLLLPLPDYS